MITALTPIDFCGKDFVANEIHVSCSRRLVSPDGDWQVIIKGDGGPAPDVHLENPHALDMGAVVADKDGHVAATFDMDRTAKIHWLTDRRTLIVNYFAGSDSTRPLAIKLEGRHAKPVDLSLLIFPDVLKRIQKRARQVYHYYVWYLADEGTSVTIVAESEYVLKGNYGPGRGRCLVYSVDKATFHSYRFIREVADDKCPESSDAS